MTDIKPIPLHKSVRTHTQGVVRGLCNNNAGGRLMG
jgi:hypothetical protein